MFRETLEMNIKRLLDFLTYSKNFIVRKNPVKSMVSSFLEGVRDFLTMNKKRKMAMYRLNYHRHQLQKMEQLIAENNQHAFLKGNNLNQTR